MSGGEILLRTGSLQGFLLGLNKDSDFSLEAKLDATRVEVKISIMNFSFLGWRFQRLDEESAKESNEESDDFTEEFIFLDDMKEWLKH